MRDMLWTNSVLVMENEDKRGIEVTFPQLLFLHTHTVFGFFGHLSQVARLTVIVVNCQLPACPNVPPLFCCD